MPRTAAEDTRERILTAAASLFYARGIRAVGMAQVVEEAGCGKNLLYREFPGKADLVAAYLRDFAERRVLSVRAATDGLDDDPAAALVAMVAEVAQRLLDPGFQGCAFRNYLREIRSYDDEPGRVAQAWIADSRAQLDDLVGRLGVQEPEVLADRVWLVLEGLYSSVTYPDRERAGATAVQLVEDLVRDAA